MDDEIETYLLGTTTPRAEEVMEAPSPCQQPAPARGALGRAFLLSSMAAMVLGGLSAPLLTRVYFVHGGARLWLTALLQNCAFPILLLPLSVSLLRRRRKSTGGKRLLSTTGRTLAAGAGLGVLLGIDSYLYAYGLAALPLSTSALLVTTQVAFTAAFAFVLVRQRFTPYSVNAVVLLVMGPAVLALQAGGDRPQGESARRYHLGFAFTLGAAALYGLLMPLIERTWAGMKETVTLALVLEVQLVMAVSATAFCSVAMAINKDFQAISREAKGYGLGETKYYAVIAATAVLWQLMNVGFVGVIVCSSSLLAGTMISMLVPLGEILPVLLLHEKFNGAKGISMVLSLWGFASYLYGEHRRQKQPSRAANGELE